MVRQGLVDPQRDGPGERLAPTVSVPVGAVAGTGPISAVSYTWSSAAAWTIVPRFRTRSCSSRSGAVRVLRSVSPA